MAINSLNASSGGLSGLVSGIDTEGVVKKLLAGTQTKIDKAEQKKAVLQLKQTMYREVAAKLTALQSTYMNFTNAKTNLYSNSFYNAKTTTLTMPSGVSSAFTAKASNSASIGSTSVQYIKQLASAYSMKTNSNATSAVGGTFNQAYASKLLDAYTGENATLNIAVGDKSLSIENATELLEGKSQSEVASIMNEKFAEAGINATARFTDNKLVVAAGNSSDVIKFTGNLDAATTEGKSLAMRMFGTSLTSLSGTGTLSTSVNTGNYQPGFTVNLDGRQQEIKLNLNDLRNYVENADMSGLQNNTSAALTRAFGSGVSLAATVDGFSLTAGNQSQKFTVTGSADMMGALGMKSGISNKINSSLSIGSLNFGTSLHGQQQTFTINGQQFSFGSGTSLTNVMNTVNNSNAGVKISYSEAEDRFVLQNSVTGAGMDGVEWSQQEGNLLSAMFGVAGSGSLTGATVAKPMVGQSMSESQLAAIAEGGKFTFTVNGKEFNINVEKRTEAVDVLDENGDPVLDENGKAKQETVTVPYTAQEVAEKVTAGFQSVYGRDAAGTSVVKVTYNEAEERFEVNSGDKSIIVGAKEKEGSLSLGFAAGDSTRVASGSQTLASAGISLAGETLSVKVGGTTYSASDFSGLTFDDAAAKLQDLVRSSVLAKDPGADVSKITARFDAQTQGIRIDMGGVGAEVEISGGEGFSKLMGASAVKLNEAATGSYTETVGTNAILSVNGTEIERGTNSFDYQGITFSLNTTMNVKADENGDMQVVSGGAAASVSVQNDNSAVVGTMKEFIKAYNDLMKYMYDLYSADTTYKSYAPLTTEQKNAMSDNEIAKWEEKSKTGLLRGDENLSKIMSAMRSAMYSKPEGGSVALYDLGVTTAGSSIGLLTEKSENSLMDALNKDPEAFINLFSGAGGIMEKLNTALNDAAKGSGSYFVKVAGSGAGDTTSSIYKQIKEIDKQMTSLESRYWGEYDRYWKQFNSMEQMIQKMNTQSSQLSSYFG